MDTYDRRVPRFSSTAIAPPTEHVMGGQCPRVSAC